MGRLITAEKKDRVLLHVTIDIAVMEDIYTQKSLQEENEKNRLLGPLGCHDLLGGAAADGGSDDRLGLGFFVPVRLPGRHHPHLQLGVLTPAA